jgi:DNA-directed RNA polymerase specialized sigma24 family protein
MRGDSSFRARRTLYRLLMKANYRDSNRNEDRPEELDLIRSEPISRQWTNELRKSIALHPRSKFLRELLSLDLYTRTVVYPFLIKGWSSSRIAARLNVSLITIQKLLEIGREQLKRKLA